MNGVSVRNMYSANIRINIHKKVHLVGHFIQLITMLGLYNIKLKINATQREAKGYNNIRTLCELMFLQNTLYQQVRTVT